MNAWLWSMNHNFYKNPQIFLPIAYSHTSKLWQKSWHKKSNVEGLSHLIIGSASRQHKLS